MTCEGERDMGRKIETELNFLQNYGGKLDRDEFTTFRGSDKLYKKDSILAVNERRGFLREKVFWGTVVVTEIVFKRIKDIHIDELLGDIGRRTSGQPRAYFYKLMEGWYKNKSWWDGENTVLQKLYCRYVRKAGS